MAIRELCRIGTVPLFFDSDADSHRLLVLK